MVNYLVHMRSNMGGMKMQTYLVVVAVDLLDATTKADRLAAMLPGTVDVLSVQEV